MTGTRAPDPPGATGGLSTHALRMARALGDRLTRELPAADERVVECQTLVPGGCSWDDRSLGCGRAGVSLFYTTLAKALPDEGWDEPADLHLRSAAAATHRRPLRPTGVFHGTAGVGAATRALLPVRPQHERAYRLINDRLASRIVADPPRRSRIGIADGDFDAMTGAAGALGYLIDVTEPSDLVLQAVHTLLSRLVWYGSAPRDEHGLLWHVTPDLFPSAQDRETFPDGYLSLGVAHGISGPLAALSLAWTRGHRVPGQAEAIIELGDRVQQFAETDAWGPRWPSRVVPAVERVKRRPHQRDRPAWCHGTPGVASALRQAGIAVADQRLTRLASEAMRATLTRPQDIGRIRDSTSICHGLSGLILMAARFVSAGDDRQIQSALEDRVSDLLVACQERSRYLVRDRRGFDVTVDCPGMLMGAAGAGLALLAAAGTPSPTLSRCLLID